MEEDGRGGADEATVALPRLPAVGTYAEAAEVVVVVVVAIAVALAGIEVEEGVRGELCEPPDECKEF